MAIFRGSASRYKPTATQRITPTGTTRAVTPSASSSPYPNYAQAQSRVPQTQINALNAAYAKKDAQTRITPTTQRTAGTRITPQTNQSSFAAANPHYASRGGSDDYRKARAAQLTKEGNMRTDQIWQKDYQAKIAKESQRGGNEVRYSRPDL